MHGHPSRPHTSAATRHLISCSSYLRLPVAGVIAVPQSSTLKSWGLALFSRMTKVLFPTIAQNHELAWHIAVAYHILPLSHIPFL